ncbi:MAG: SHOCT domain-containing protein, partial [Microbacterium sp.]|nr:SHOCT domain-containing protein [Microbacterium sp.]
AAAPTVKNLGEQIQDLAALRDTGVLTEEEFTAVQKRLLE